MTLGYTDKLQNRSSRFREKLLFSPRNLTLPSPYPGAVFLLVMAAQPRLGGLIAKRMDARDAKKDAPRCARVPPECHKEARTSMSRIVSVGPFQPSTPIPTAKRLLSRAGRHELFPTFPLIIMCISLLCIKALCRVKCWYGVRTQTHKPCLTFGDRGHLSQIANLDFGALAASQ